MNQYKTDQGILSAAIAIIFLQPEKDGFAEVNAVFEFVRDSIRYTQDVLNVETICSPWATLQRRVGDCDDKSTLLATLAECVGYPTRFVVAGYFGSKDFEHVYCQIFLNGEWVDADATEREPLGYAPPVPSALYIEGA
ncbi:MAG: transglutaminase-like domain-containing protein [Fluviibacter sp.]